MVPDRQIIGAYEVFDSSTFIHEALEHGIYHHFHSDVIPFAEAPLMRRGEDGLDAG